MLQVHRAGKRRSEAILAPNFSLENGATGQKNKMARFCSDHCGSGLSCGRYRMAPELSDDRPPMPQKIPAPKGRNLCTNGERRSPFHAEPRHSSRAVANSPVALRFPKQIFLHCTPVRRARSALLLVGSTPSCSRKVNSRSLCSHRARARFPTSRWELFKCCSARVKIRF